MSCKERLILYYQPQGEAGSAGRQPASNKADDDDCQSGLIDFAVRPLFDNQSESCMANKTH